MVNFRRIVVSAALILLFFMYPCINALACTVFVKYDDSHGLVGNNEDWLYSYDSTYWTVRGNDTEYARICFGISSYVQGGMNEKGLFYDGATCPETEVPYDESKEQLGMDAGEVVLSKCATVKEAVEFLSGYNIAPGFGDHLIFADSSGDAAVVEWVESEMKVLPVENNQLVATNFFLSNPDLGGYPCERYNMATEILNKGEPLNPLAFSNILSSTTQHWGDGGTKYSNVYDLTNLKVYLYEKADFSKVSVISLRDELENLTADEKIIKNINSLTYQETSALLGGEVIDYRQVSGIETEDGVFGGDEIIAQADASGVVETTAEKPEPGESQNGEPESNHYGFVFIICVIIISIIIFFCIVVLRKRLADKKQL